MDLFAVGFAVDLVGRSFFNTFFTCNGADSTKL